MQAQLIGSPAGGLTEVANVCLKGHGNIKHTSHLKYPDLIPCLCTFFHRERCWVISEKPWSMLFISDLSVEWEKEEKYTPPLPTADPFLFADVFFAFQVTVTGVVRHECNWIYPELPHSATSASHEAPGEEP